MEEMNMEEINMEEINMQEINMEQMNIKEIKGTKKKKKQTNIIFEIEEESTAAALAPTTTTIITEDHSKTVLTEDLGKIFEMAICMLYGIDYDGKYKYSLDEAAALKNRIVKLIDVFPHNIKHTAKNGNQYDYTGVEDTTIKLSAKSTKKDGKVCPQVIGQPSKKKFCEFFKIPLESDSSISLEKIKTHIEENVMQMLAIYFINTFDCPIIYYNKKLDKLLFITTNQDIQWNNFVIEFSHKKKNKIWGESSTISINNKTIGEFQVHNHRDCIKFRWAFENILALFADHFTIVTL